MTEEKVKKYEDYEKRLAKIYGEHDDLLGIIISHLEKMECLQHPEFLPAGKTRLLTDEHVEMWEAYKKLGTPEEIKAKLDTLAAYEDTGLDPQEIYSLKAGTVLKAMGCKWISVEDKLPEDVDRRFFMCLVENHLEDPPMMCQYEEEYGFGFWKDIYDPATLGFVDSEFETMEELKYEKVLYWMLLIEPPEEEEDDE